MKTYRVVCQGWKRVDAEGKDIRADGYSLHLTKHDLKLYSQKRLRKKWFWFLFKPDNYCQLDNEPYDCYVDSSTYQELRRKMKKHGVWYHSEGCPSGKYGRMPPRCKD